MMQFCNRCVYPASKPDLFIDAYGVCSACRAFELRPEIDWPQRMDDLRLLLGRYRAKDPGRYDCIVPGSGGKDSTYQALKMREMGMNPLIVTATTDMLSELGRRNIENLKRQGFDYIEVTPNVAIRRKINKLALELVGDISWPEHVLIFTIPVRLAVQMGIPLIVWGENSQNEYGGPKEAQASHILDRKWLEEFGGLLGLRVSDIVDMLSLDPKELIQYTYPDQRDLKRVGVTGIFLGHYIPWSGKDNAIYARLHGWQPYSKLVEGSCVDYENLDNYFTGIHDYFKFLKYGYGRTSDLVSMAIRRGQMTREEGVEMVRKRDGAFPADYLGLPLGSILKEIGMDLETFHKTVDKFRNKKLFIGDQLRSQVA